MSGLPRMTIGKELGDVSDATLRFFKQIGVEHVGIPPRPSTEPTRSRPLVPPAQTGPPGPQPEPWDPSELRRVRERVARFGLTASAIALPVSGRILLGIPGRDADIERARRSIAAAGEAGFSVVTYGFTALRASEGYGLVEGRGGTQYRAFDAARVAGLPPLAEVGTHTREGMWERLAGFLAAVVPAAEAASVRLAAHPNDPPVPEFRGVAQPLSTFEDLKRLIAAADSPSNSVYVDTGVLTEMGEDAPAAIRWLGGRGRIGCVHFRNARVGEAYFRYTETFLDDGDCDMTACVRALRDVGYVGMVEPDHTPGIRGDTLDTWIGWAYAIGQIVALRRAAESVAPSG